MPETITSLIEKLEAASEGSRELDFWIWLALERDNTVVPQIPASFQSKRGDEFELYDANERCVGWVGFQVVPHYSLSIDAALALAERVLPGWAWNIDRWGKMSRVTLNECDAEGWHKSKHRRIEVAAEQPPALALCAAVLRAQSEARV